MLGYIYNEDFFYRKILNTDKNEVLRTLAIKNSFYTERSIVKKNGIRQLSCIQKHSSIYNLQNNLRLNFLINVPLPENVKGFIPNNSYRDFLFPHVGKKFYVRLDIKNFFNNITSDMIINAFKDYFRLEDQVGNRELLEIFSQIVTLNDVLPQGGVTSPNVSNIIFRRLDIRISKYCKRYNITYTRYADDLLFSSNSNYLHNPFFVKKISYILNDYKFKINSSKIMKASNYISLNGFVIRDEIYLSRKRKNDISKILFLIEKNNSPNRILEILNAENFYYKKYKFEDIWDLVNYLVGYRSFLISWLPNDKSSVNYLKIERLIKRIENNIDSFIQ